MRHADDEVETFQEDLEIIGVFAREAQSPTSLYCGSTPFFTAAAALGMGGYDTGAVVGVWRRMAGWR